MDDNWGYPHDELEISSKSAGWDERVIDSCESAYCDMIWLMCDLAATRWPKN